MLGDTIEKIAWQKCGIIKPEANVFTVQQPSGCENVIKSRAEEKNVSLFRGFSLQSESAQYFSTIKIALNLTRLQWSYVI